MAAIESNLTDYNRRNDRQETFLRWLWKNLMLLVDADRLKEDKTMAREDYKMKCARCDAEAMRSELKFSYDCQGIPFRLVCSKCADEIEAIGYDGQYYDSSDECLDYDY